MKIIECMIDHIDEELDDAEEYIKEAQKYKEEYPEVGQLFHMLANEEISHADKLHAVTVSMINAYKMKNKDVPADMVAVYNYAHKKYIDKENKIKLLIANY